MHTRHLLWLVTPLVMACGGGGYGGDSPTQPNPPGTGSTSNAISVTDNSFGPSSTTVPVGTTVTWTWGGSTAHNVTFPDGTHSNSQTTGSFQRTFATAGTFNYQCTLHAGMTGKVTVQ